MITRDEADRSIEVHVSGCRRAETCGNVLEALGTFPRQLRFINATVLA